MQEEFITRVVLKLKDRDDLRPLQAKLTVSILAQLSLILSPKWKCLSLGCWSEAANCWNWQSTSHRYRHYQSGDRLNDDATFSSRSKLNTFWSVNTICRTFPRFRREKFAVSQLFFNGISQIHTHTPVDLFLITLVEASLAQVYQSKPLSGQSFCAKQLRTLSMWHLNILWRWENENKYRTYKSEKLGYCSYYFFSH